MVFDCFYTDSIQISIASEDCSCNVYIPNVINSNSGINSAFVPNFSCDIQTYNMDIYNRWGNLIFSTNSVDETWSPFNNSDDLSGVFTYRITYQYPDSNEVLQKVGSITLLK